VHAACSRIGAAARTTLDRLNLRSRVRHVLRGRAGGGRPAPSEEDGAGAGG